MFRIKVCGITNVDDALLVANAGADAVGLNFYPQSPRSLDTDRAQWIADALPPGLLRVGLFVNASQEAICQTAERLRLDLVQVHGDEPPEFLAGLAPLAVMRAFRVGLNGLPSVLQYLDRCRQLNCMPRMVLLDSHVPGSYGGSGAVGDWELLSAYGRRSGLPGLVLAGGLTSENVARAIRTVRPRAVDVASGVESCPGRKSPERLMAFVAHARDALEELDQQDASK